MLNKLLLPAPSLKLSNTSPSSCPFALATDAIDTTVGAVFAQVEKMELSTMFHTDADA